MKKGLWIIMGLALIAALTCSCAPSGGQEGTPSKDQESVPTEEERSATVVEVVNKVDAHPRPKDDWQPAVVDMAIYGGGQVRTGAASSARLELLEGVVRLAAESLFTVKESATRQGKLVTSLFLQEGRLWAHLTTSQPHEFSVETASAVAAVRDTRFSIMDSDQTTLVSVAEGEVVVTAQGVSVTVVAGQQVIVKPGQPPSPPEPMSDEERRLWATEGEMPELAPPTPTPVPPTATPTPTIMPTPTPTVTPTPVPPTATPTVTSTPTPTEAPPVGPQDSVFKAEDGQELMGTYYPPPVCSPPLTIVYFPWVRSDRRDVKEIAPFLPEDLSYGTFAITTRGCEGGCPTWDRPGWRLDYSAALDAAKRLPCAGQSRLVTIGSSIGADGAIYACAKEENCVGALAFSANGYLDIPYADEVASMVEQGKHVWSVSAEGDSGAARLDRPDWSAYYHEIVLPGEGHGNQLFNSSAQTIRDFIECAAHSFELEKCHSVGQ
jgi:hypothetical protein